MSTSALPSPPPLSSSSATTRPPLRRTTAQILPPEFASFKPSTQHVLSGIAPHLFLEGHCQARRLAVRTPSNSSKGKTSSSRRRASLSRRPDGNRVVYEVEVMTRTCGQVQAAVCLAPSPLRVCNPLDLDVDDQLDATDSDSEFIPLSPSTTLVSTSPTPSSEDKDVDYWRFKNNTADLDEKPVSCAHAKCADLPSVNVMNSRSWWKRSVSKITFRSVTLS
ncbi:hypothetical protein BDV98DRAFT_335732 [Pterulicium gracile]|uniref:Uncharacterized protein n=1 Tax=Pterulicium gracile TaxID=1884261 RepID=A0A5C3Q5K8_9AGAR|nr:hypothetical protein BDV98DRAFT_335732 [Pterula gracilis]